MATSPTARTLQYFKKQNIPIDIVERFNSFSGKRTDMLGMFDLVALDLITKRILGIQVTSGANVSARLKKIKDNPYHKDWLKCGGGILVMGWSKKGKAGKRKLWTPRIIEIL